MRLARLTLLALLTLSSAVALAACASAPPEWTYAPAPSATPLPSADASGEASPPASGNILISALGSVFEQASVDVPAGVAFKLDFDNKDAGVPHDVDIHVTDRAGAMVFGMDPFTGVALKTFDIPALEAGTYAFVCSIHSNMNGVMNAK